MRTIKLLLPILLLSATAHGADLFRMCDDNSECVVVEGICPNSWTAVNRGYEAQYETNANSKRPYADCEAPDLSVNAPDRALCVKDKCVTEDEAEQ